MADQPLFDQQARLLRRERAGAAATDPFLAHRAFEDVVDRLGAVQRRFTDALLVGALDPSWGEHLKRLADRVTVVDPSPGLARRVGGSAIAEGGLPFEAGSFDLYVSAGTLDTAHDLPFALMEARRVLRPDALFIGAVPGAGSLPRLRAAMAAADDAAGRAAPRLHPGLDARTMGDLLARAQFVLTVVDIDRVSVGYCDMTTLVRDLRAHAATNILSRRSRTPLTKSALRAALSAFSPDPPRDRVYERIELLHFLGWTPGPDQPRPARRGSATASLASALSNTVQRAEQS